MPYQVTSLQDGYCYTAVVPRRLLAHTIIKYLAKKGLSLADFKHIVEESHLNPLMIIDESEFQSMLSDNPGLDLIYDSVQLKDNSLIHYHTNWTVPQNNWQLMAAQLNVYDINVTTIQTQDLPSSIKTKTKMEDSEPSK
ncbi:hypothetical protein [Hydrogenovibrio kuenenii]|uniref:hypothetical protein n=1 Tax=Hydrogenovibrio kuenenii TaxID=63658 RepID=UPI00046321A7|nr:hypothetical protein [Hydrogenovibrio kuenenii]